jgi:hypothetical protein
VNQFIPSVGGVRRFEGLTRLEVFLSAFDIEIAVAILREVESFHSFVGVVSDGPDS